MAKFFFKGIQGTTAKSSKIWHTYFLKKYSSKLDNILAAI